MVRSTLEYCSPVWDPHHQKDIDALEKVNVALHALFQTTIINVPASLISCPPWVGQTLKNTVLMLGSQPFTKFCTVILLSLCATLSHLLTIEPEAEKTVHTTINIYELQPKLDSMAISSLTVLFLIGTPFLNQ